MDEATIVQLLYELDRAQRRVADKKGDALTLLHGRPGEIPTRQLAAYGEACAEVLRIETALGLALQMHNPEHFTIPTRC